MSSRTPNLDLIKPDPSDKVDIMNLNANFDILDGLVPPDIADYPIEIGKVGIWNYEKWKSGKSVCYGTVSYWISQWIAQGNFFVALPGINPEFPSNLFIEKPDIMYSPSPDGISIIGVKKWEAPTTTHFGTLIAMNYELTSTGVPASFGVKAVGRWK